MGRFDCINGVKNNEHLKNRINELLEENQALKEELTKITRELEETKEAYFASMRSNLKEYNTEELEKDWVDIPAYTSDDFELDEF